MLAANDFHGFEYLIDNLPDFGEGDELIDGEILPQRVEATDVYISE